MIEKKWIAGIFALGCAAACAVMLFHKEDPVVVQTKTANEGIMTITETYKGVLARERTALAVPNGVGTVTAVYVAEGDRVNAGDPLYQLDTTLYETELVSAMAKQALIEETLQGDALETAQSWAQSEIEALEYALEQCTVRAPIDGEVTYVGDEKGVPAQEGVLLSAGAYKAVIYVPDASAGKLREGMEVSVSRDGKSSQGVLGELTASSVMEGYFEAEVTGISISNAKSGMSVDATVETQSYAGVLVPIECLYAQEDAVLCVIDGVTVHTPVDVLCMDAFYAVAEGLPSGLALVIQPDACSEGIRVEQDAQD